MKDVLLVVVVGALFLLFWDVLDQRCEAGESLLGILSWLKIISSLADDSRELLRCVFVGCA